MAVAGHEIPLFICFGGVDKGVVANAYLEKWLAFHVLRHYQGLSLLRCYVVKGLYLSVRLICGSYDSGIDAGFCITE